ncbi:hypothetical protein K3X48_11070 [Aliiroseovarius crassostreae]|uniref:Uncharacterized protein n=1 Tax=Aliiroseovarius crassostreae TaxID=154981 RepID=A0A9Q9HDE7_9RHOB|nr:hypothetical protein [Aliiroseovarius crassostreae]UWP94750.1 hypothetical protein K3X48_11070 [Aliiroseovarius crassostreae]
MVDEPAKDQGVEGEIVPDSSPLPPNASSENWLAVVSNYTERPDLFLAEVEKNDPGFIARMNKASERRASETERARFAFSKLQAYVSLTIASIAALVILWAAFRYITEGNTSFWPLVGLGIFYAITQGGTLGFEKVVTALTHLLGKAPKQ